MDGNGIGDGTDCGGTITFDANGVRPPRFPARTGSTSSRVSAFPDHQTRHRGHVSIAIFSEKNGSSVWDATKQFVTLTFGCTASTAPCLTFSVEDVIDPVKTNQNGQGTCSSQNLADPDTGQDDGIKDFKCQFATSGLPTGTHFGVVSGYFVDRLDSNEVKAFSARQEVTILP